jgi:hypothetical protein
VRRLALLVVALVLAAPASPVHAARPEAVHGTWQTLVPAALTSFHPSTADPTTGTFTAIGSTAWSGTWTGVTTYTMSGTIDLITNESSGILDETFTGRQGTLSLHEHFTLDAAGHLRITCRIVHGTGDYAGSRGRVVFDGQMIGVVSGSGTYSGQLRQS